MLLATDLHAGNVLQAHREPWLVIDPKPFAGDPAFDATQHLLNCAGRLRSEPRGTIQRFAGLVGVGAERIRMWSSRGWRPRRVTIGATAGGPTILRAPSRDNVSADLQIWT